MTELIVTEKPSSAKKIAEALADGKVTLKKSGQSQYYELSHGKQEIIVTSAVGHLFGLMEEKGSSYTYPVFDIKWEPSYKVAKGLAYVKDYIDTISSLSKRADEFTVACDYDVEGEVIGWNVIRFVCKKKDANRMKFSTLTKPDLVEAYEHKMKHLDWGQAQAGETRHKLDWYYGINLSRALTTSVKAAGSFKVMSAGRVQGPALKLLVDREKEIAAFKPEPFWMIGLWGDYKQIPIEAWHIKDKIFDAKEVKIILDKVKSEREAKVKEVKRTKREQAPPYPFDLTTLQTESYNVFKITPKETLDIAQSLYLMGVTSYPRTSSQQLDPKLGFKKILTDLSRQPEYDKMCKELLKLPQLKPNNGSKTDPAHPAIYPTGLAPGGLKNNEKRIYDLIVKRFMATFSKAAIRETMEVSLDVKQELFITKGTRTVEENWHVFYKPYVKLEEVTLPEMKEGDAVKIKEIKKVDKETQPPKRYNQSSIIKELEKRNLGTKATRADILERLFQRGYVEGVQITVTQIGMQTTEILEKYAPTIVEEKLTADFEEDMEEIREGKEKPEKVLNRAKEILIKLLADFKKKEKLIGKEIIQSVRDTQDITNYIGKCPTCAEGKLMQRHGKYGAFVACDQYPKCSTTFKLPHGLIKSSDKLCENCKYPMINIISGRRKQEICLNPRCPTKTSKEDQKEINKIEANKVDRTCPKCGKPMVVRSSVYGQFLGCSGYPVCKQIEKISNGENGSAPAAPKITINIPGENTSTAVTEKKEVPEAKVKKVSSKKRK
ncbi:MAG: DNA topoisomerase I [Candidatus Woesearchaeota archaeon]